MRPFLAVLMALGLGLALSPALAQTPQPPAATAPAIAPSDQLDHCVASANAIWVKLQNADQEIFQAAGDKAVLQAKLAAALARIVELEKPAPGPPAKPEPPPLPPPPPQ